MQIQTHHQKIIDEFIHLSLVERDQCEVHFVLLLHKHRPR